MPLTSPHLNVPERLGQGFGAKALLLGALVLAVFSACTTAGPTPPPGAAGADELAVWVTNEQSIQILPTQALAGRLELRQLIEGEYQGQRYVLEAIVDADEEHFSLIALNSFGTQVFDLEYDRGGIRYESGLPLGGFKPAYLMADFQLCYFPTAVVAEMVETAGLGFKEESINGGQRRSVSRGDQLLIEVERRSGKLLYRNVHRGYAYTITEAP